MSTPVACDESLMRVRYGPDAGENASAAAVEAADGDPAPAGGADSTTSVDAQGTSKQEL